MSEPDLPLLFDSDGEMLPFLALGSISLNTAISVPASVTVAVPSVLVFRRCPCGCWISSDAAAPCGFISNSASDDKRMWPLSKLRSAVDAAEFPDLAGRSWALKLRLGSEMIPLGSGQRLIDVPDGKYFVHVQPATIATSSGHSGHSTPSIPRLSSNKRQRDDEESVSVAETIESAASLAPSALRPPLFVFSSPAAVGSLPLFTEYRAIKSLNLLATVNHDVVDASFADLKSKVLALRPGGLHIAAHIAEIPGDPDAEPVFLFRDDNAEGVPRSFSSNKSGFNAQGELSAQQASSSAPPYTTVSFSDVVEFLKPFGAMKPGGFIEFVFVNACSSEALLHRLHTECGIPYLFGWKTKAIDAACYTFAHNFYRALTHCRNRKREDATDRPCTYERAYKIAMKAYTKRGFIVDDPNKYAIVCATHGCDAGQCRENTRACRQVYKHNHRLAVTKDVTGLGRHGDYSPPVVHGIPAHVVDEDYQKMYHGVPRLPLRHQSGGKLDGSCREGGHESDGSAGSLSGYDSDHSEDAHHDRVSVSSSRRKPKSPGKVSHVNPHLFSVEVLVKGRIYDNNAINEVLEWFGKHGFRYDVVDVRPSGQLNGRYVASFKLFHPDKRTTGSVAELLSKFVATLCVHTGPSLAPAPAIADPSISFSNVSISASEVSFCVDDDGPEGPGLSVKQVSEVYPVLGLQNSLVTKFLQFTGHLWTSGFMSEVILQKFADPRCKGHIRLPAATCQFGNSKQQTSIVVVQVSDDTLAGCLGIVRALTVATQCFNTIKRATKQVVTMREVAFPTPVSEPARATMQYEHRCVIDLGGDLIGNGFTRDMYYTLTGMRDPESSDHDGSDTSSACHAFMDFCVLSFNFGVEGQTSSTISLAVSADSRKTLWRIFINIDLLTRAYEKSNRGSIDINVRWYHYSTFMGQGVDAAYAVEDGSESDLSDDDSVDFHVAPVSNELELTPHATAVSTTLPHESKFTPISIPRGHSGMSGPSGYRQLSKRFIKVTGPLISSRFHENMLGLFTSYSRYLRPRLITFRGGCEAATCVFMQVSGCTEKERETYSYVVQTAIELYCRTEYSIRSVEQYLLPNRSLLTASEIAENCYKHFVSFPDGTSLPELEDVDTSDGYEADGDIDPDISLTSRPHQIRVLLDRLVINALDSLIRACGGDVTATIAMLPTGFEVLSNSESAAQLIVDTLSAIIPLAFHPYD